MGERQWPASSAVDPPIEADEAVGRNSGCEGEKKRERDMARDKIVVAQCGLSLSLARSLAAYLLVRLFCPCNCTARTLKRARGEAKGEKSTQRASSTHDRPHRPSCPSCPVPGRQLWDLTSEVYEIARPAPAVSIFFADTPYTTLLLLRAVFAIDLQASRTHLLSFSPLALPFSLFLSTLGSLAAQGLACVVLPSDPSSLDHRADCQLSFSFLPPTPSPDSVYLPSWLFWATLLLTPDLPVDLCSRRRTTTRLRCTAIRVPPRWYLGLVNVTSLATANESRKRQSQRTIEHSVGRSAASGPAELHFAVSPFRTQHWARLFSSFRSIVFFTFKLHTTPNLSLQWRSSLMMPMAPTVPTASTASTARTNLRLCLACPRAI